MKPRPVLPLPEAIPNRRDGWKQKTAAPVPGSPFCNSSQRILATPHDDDDLSRAIRAHEIGHAKYSPALFDPEELGATAGTIAAVEEARVNTLVSRSVSLDSLRCDDVDGAAIERALKNDDALTAVRIGVAAVGSGRRVAIDAALTAAGKSTITDAVRSAMAGCEDAFYDTAAGFRVTVAIARAIDAAFGYEPPTEEEEEGAGGDGDGDGGEDGDDGDVDPGMMSRAIKGSVRDERRSEEGERSRENRWGDMRIVRPPLPIPVRGAIVRKSRPSDIGAVPKRFDRLAIDGNVFDRKRRLPGGTIAIDCSGSMSLSASDVDAILRALPGATVATYNGSWNHGELRIVAERGRIAKEDDLRGGMTGNVIDGPVLEWLAKQSQPRIWLCDGMVTGVNDAAAPNLTFEAMRIARRGSIRRAGNLAETLAAIGRKG